MIQLAGTSLTESKSPGCPSGFLSLQDDSHSNTHLVLCDGVFYREALDAIAQKLSGDRCADSAQLVAAVKSVHKVVLEQQEKHRDNLTGWESLAEPVLVTIHDNVARACWIGGSLAFHIREGAVINKSKEHTYRQELINEGKPIPEQWSREMGRNIMTRYLGTPVEPVPELTAAWTLLHRDTIVLCSQCVDVAVDRVTLLSLASAEEPHQAARGLAEAAIAGGATVTATVVVAKFEQ